MHPERDGDTKHVEFIRNKQFDYGNNSETLIDQSSIYFPARRSGNPIQAESQLINKSHEKAACVTNFKGPLDNSCGNNRLTSLPHNHTIDLALPSDNHRIDLIPLSNTQLNTLASLVSQKIQSNSKSSSIITFILRILGFVLFVIVLQLSLSILADGVSNSLLWSKSFKNLDTEGFKYHDLISNKTDLKDNVDKIVNMNAWIRNLPTETILQMVEPSSFATILYGVPGTGKTVFVESLCYKVDLKLREKYLLDTSSKEFIETLRSTESFDEYIEDSPSKVKYYYITPSLINDKYVGGSERNVKSLFDTLYAEDNDKYSVTIVLFDEAESFFNERNSEIAKNSSDTSVKCEFLTKISQVPTKFKSVFLFAATNSPNLIDSAFMRRFGNKIHFEVPDKDERQLIIESTLEKCKLSSDQINQIVEKTSGRSQAFIKRTCKSYVTYGEHGQIISYDFDKYIDFLNNMTHHQMF